MTGIHLKLGEVGEVSLKENTNRGRGEDIDHLLLPSLLDHLLQILKREAKDLRGLNKLVRGEEDVQCCLLLPLLLVIL